MTESRCLRHLLSERFTATWQPTGWSCSPVGSNSQARYLHNEDTDGQHEASGSVTWAREDDGTVHAEGFRAAVPQHRERALRGVRAECGRVSAGVCVMAAQIHTCHGARQVETISGEWLVAHKTEMDGQSCRVLERGPPAGKTHSTARAWTRTPVSGRS